MCARSIISRILLAAVLLGAFAARAEEVIYGPDGAPTVVQRKLYTMSSKWEVTALFDIAMNTALIDQLGGVVGLSYHPNEWLDVGVEALVNHGALSSLSNNIRADLCRSTPCRAITPKKDEFANDNQLRLGGFGVARLSPIYGKLDLASELKVHFQAFALLGAGIAAVHRESVNLCADAGPDACTNFQQSDATKGVGEIGAGFRFYFNQRWSLSTEVRGYFFPSSYKAGNDLTTPSSGTPTNYLAGIVTFDAGLSVLF